MFGVVEAEEGSTNDTRGAEGINKFAYWASNSPAGPWNILPDLAPEHLASAKGIKVMFTGDLNRKIVTNPFYFKQEKDYLRATIARICFSTTLVPKGIYKLTEVEPPEVPTEIEENVPEDDKPVPIPSTNDMCRASNWVHYTKNILQCNRLVHPEE